jgi:sucrose phosphorylase
VQTSGIKRRINREKLHLDQVNADLDNPESMRSRVFTGLMELLKVRTSSTAFHPSAACTVIELGRNIFALLRENKENGCRILALHNLSGTETACAIPGDFSLETARDLLDETATFKPPYVLLPAYGIRWLSIND